jgi:alkylresorcinol/alkylpyrone synthase
VNPKIIRCGTALPAHYYPQQELLSALQGLWSERHYNTDRLAQFHRNMQVDGRHLSRPIEFYLAKPDFGERNRAYQEVGLELAQQSLSSALEGSGLTAQEVGSMVFTTVTGLSVPSLDARLMNKMALPNAMRRMPIFGLGCLAGAAGVARLSDILRGHPSEAGALVSVELCSLTLQSADLSVPNLVSTGLFGDGSASVLMVGKDHPLASSHPGPEVLATRSIFFPNSEHVMGWDFSSEGFQVVLSPEVPIFAKELLIPALLEFIAEQGLKLDQIDRWVAHPGGPKVVQAMAEGLDVPIETFEPTLRSLAKVGNLSSASVLFVLKDALDNPPPAGSYGILMAMGPAFCAEVALLRW